MAIFAYITEDDYEAQQVLDAWKYRATLQELYSEMRTWYKNDVITLVGEEAYRKVVSEEGDNIDGIVQWVANKLEDRVRAFLNECEAEIL